MTALVFAYTVQAADRDNDGIYIGNQDSGNPTFDLQAGQTIVSATSGIDALLEHDTLETLPVHLVDGSLTGADATLSALSLNNGITLSPAFAAGTESYTASAAVASATVTATASQTGANVVISPADADTNTPDHQVPLVAGENTITVTVTSSNGNSTRTYTITIERDDVVDPRIVDGGVAVTSAPLWPDNTYGSGDHIEITVTFSEQVNVGGNPQFGLEVGGKGRLADLSRGSGTTTLVFAYTVDDSDSDSDGIRIGAHDDADIPTLTLDSTDTITSVDTSRDADLTHPSLGVLSGHNVDGSIANVNLSSLALSGYELSPAFNRGTISYTADTAAALDLSCVTTVKAAQEGEYRRNRDNHAHRRRRRRRRWQSADRRPGDGRPPDRAQRGNEHRHRHRRQQRRRRVEPRIHGQDHPARSQLLGAGRLRLRGRYWGLHDRCFRERRGARADR